MYGRTAPRRASLVHSWSLVRQNPPVYHGGLFKHPTLTTSEGPPS